MDFDMDMKSTKDKIVNKSDPTQLSIFFNRISLMEDDFEAEEYFKKFSALKTNCEKVDLVYRDLLKYDEFLKPFPEFVEDQKNDAEATELKEAGNKEFALGKFSAAVRLYTRSIALAKKDQNRAVAYANRSAALLKLGLFDECIVDVNRALDNNYPEHLKPKVLTRREHAEKKSKEPSRKKNASPIPEIPENEKNPNIQSARDCVEIKTSKTYGRCVIATRNIKAGEVLAFEKSFACHLSQEVFTHCHECFEICYNPIPCENCTQTVYCSVDCRVRAFENYHRFECPIVKSLVNWGVDKIKLLALKVGFMNKVNSDSDVTEDNCYRSDRFKEFLQLHPHTDKRFIADLVTRSMYTAKFFHLVKNHTGFFDNSVNKKTEESAFKDIVLLAMQIIPINNCSVAEVTPKENGNLMLFEIGISVYPFLSLFNHSCCHNVNRHYYGSRVALVANSPIKKGEQCFITYGPQYMSYEKSDRQAHLKSVYYFDCKCKACVEDWNPKTMVPIVSDPAIIFGMNRVKFNHVYAEVYNGNLEYANRYLDVFIKQLENHKYQNKPSKEYRYLQEIVYQCFNLRANRRLF